MKRLLLAPLVLLILSSCSKPTKEEISDRAYKKCESIPVSKLIEWAKCMGENDPNFIID
tara:strand:+ start:439 stop:615 length:177 start_codon:yes stop_codon:yes gene_type:complete